MRKQDYATLANIIKTRREAAQAGYRTAENADDKARSDAAAATLNAVAKSFAARTSVDRAAFLKACGIE